MEAEKQTEKEKAVDPEVVREGQELETAPGPEHGGIVPVTDERLKDILELAENAAKLVEAHKKIWVVLLSMCQPRDWTIFKGQDGKETGEIGIGGAMRVNAVLGVSFTNWESHKDQGSDDKGDWYRWEFMCDAILGKRSIRVYGRAGSRDKFLGKKAGEFRPLHEISEGDVKMIAMRSAMKEGIKTHAGFHHMDVDFLKKHGIELGSAGGHEFKSDDKKASETLMKVIEVARLQTISLKDGKKKYIIEAVDGSRFNTWSETQLKMAEQAKEKNLLIEIAYTYDEKWGNQMIGAEVKGPK